MISRPRLVVLAVAIATAAVVAIPRAQVPSPKPQAPRWFKGNLHTHTVNSDGDSTPDDVVRWYRERDYQFLVLTDHNYLTSVDGLNAVHGADDKFVVVKGEEITDRFDGKPLHINGFNMSRLVAPTGGSSVVDVVQRAVDAIRGAGGVPSINHPNFGWAISPDELGQVQRTKLFEVFNGHPTVNNLGGGGVPGLEETWDRILSSGKMLYGLAVDDAHYFRRPEDPTAPRPGKGWVYVRSPRLEAGALVEALERGDFYSSTGVQMQAIDQSATALSLTIKAETASKYRIQFIGRQGRVLSEATTPSATYTFRGDEGYVRAKVWESNGKAAWIQPVPVGAGAPK
jgi:hypothetical protein